MLTPPRKESSDQSRCSQSMRTHRYASWPRVWTSKDFVCWRFKRFCAGNGPWSIPLVHCTWPLPSHNIKLVCSMKSWCSFGEKYKLHGIGHSLWYSTPRPQYTTIINHARSIIIFPLDSFISRRHLLTISHRSSEHSLIFRPPTPRRTAMSRDMSVTRVAQIHFFKALLGPLVRTRLRPAVDGIVLRAYSFDLHRALWCCVSVATSGQNSVIRAQ